MVAVGGGAAGEHAGTVFGDEQGEAHRARRGEPAAPRRARGVDVQVEGYAGVSDQARVRGPGQEVVETLGQRGLVATRREDGRERVAGRPRLAQVGVVGVDRLRLVVGAEQGGQLYRRGQEVAVARTGRGVGEREGEVGPAPESEGHAVTVLAVKPVTPTTRLLVVATASRLADEAAGVAVVLHVVARTGDPRLAGLVVAAFALPTLVTGPVIGAYIDRLRSPRPLFVANQAILAGALTGILLAAGRAPGAVLVGLGLLAGLTAPVLTGGFSGLVPRLVPPAPAPPHPAGPVGADALAPSAPAHAGWSGAADGAAAGGPADRRRVRALARANAVDTASYEVAGLGGPALVAALASLAGAGPALAAAAATAVAGVALVAVAPMPRRPAPRPAPLPMAAEPPAMTGAGGALAAEGAGGGWSSGAGLAAKRSERCPAGATVAPTADPGRDESLPAAVRAGLALLWRVPVLRAATVATTFGYAAQGLLPVAFPLLAVHFGHQTAQGAWFLTALSAGSLAGAAVSARLVERFAPVRVLVGAMAALGVTLAGVAAAPGLGTALAVATLGGVATGPLLAATLAVRQRSVPSGRYAQVAATAASLKVGAFALGAAATGPVLAAVGPRTAVLLVGLAQLAALAPLLPLARRHRH